MALFGWQARQSYYLWQIGRSPEIALAAPGCPPGAPARVRNTGWFDYGRGGIVVPCTPDPDTTDLAIQQWYDRELAARGWVRGRATADGCPVDTFASWGHGPDRVACLASPSIGAVDASSFVPRSPVLVFAIYDLRAYWR